MTRERWARLVLIAGILTGFGTSAPPDTVDGMGVATYRTLLGPGERVVLRGELRTSNLERSAFQGSLRLTLRTIGSADGIAGTLRFPVNQLFPENALDAGTFDPTVRLGDAPSMWEASESYVLTPPLGSTDFEVELLGGPASRDLDVELAATMRNEHPGNGLCSERIADARRPVVRLRLEEVARTP